jgi:hypothetical protein
VAQLIADANDESANRQHKYIGTEHLRLALSRPAADTSRWLDLGVEPRRMYDLINDTIQRGREQRFQPAVTSQTGLQLRDTSLHDTLSVTITVHP